MKVLAIDPGGHVGLALYTDKHQPGNGGPFEEKWTEWEDTPEKWYAVADNWVQWADVIVCEDFIISGARAKEANLTIEMIGVMRYLAALWHKPFVTQTPTDAKKFSTTAKAKTLGWYKPAKADHARSATRHLILYLARAGVITDRLLPSVDEGGG